MILEIPFPLQLILVSGQFDRWWCRRIPFTWVPHQLDGVCVLMREHSTVCVYVRVCAHPYHIPLSLSSMDHLSNVVRHTHAYTHVPSIHPSPTAICGYGVWCGERERDHLHLSSSISIHNLSPTIKTLSKRPNDDLPHLLYMCALSSVGGEGLGLLCGARALSHGRWII